MDFITADKESLNEALEFQTWFVDLIDNNRERLHLYLADNAVLDWFGRTIKGPANISYFLRSQSYEHALEAAVPIQGDLGSRSTHIVRTRTVSENSGLAEPLALSPADSNFDTSSFTTPPNKAQNNNVLLAGPSRMLFGDGSNDLTAKMPSRESPRLAERLAHIELGQGDCRPVMVDVTCKIKAGGAVQFHRISRKKGIPEIKWMRPCTLKVAYTPDLQAKHNYTVHLIIYEDSMLCRRNLLPDFEKCQD